MDEHGAAPDGFALSPADPLYGSQLLLNEYLATEVGDLERYTPDPKWKKLPKRQSIELIQSILRRFAWLREHDSELVNAHRARLRLVKLLRLLYTRKLPCTEFDLRMLLDLTVPLLEHIAPDGPVDYVIEYLKDNDLTPELCRSLRNFCEHLVESGSVASMQSLRQRLYMCLWMDEWDPLDPARCWSECIRRDFRDMAGDRKNHWRQLLKHIRGNAPVHMPAGWARDAEQLLKHVGIDDFSEQLAVWFAPFQSGQPLPLSVAGSYVLKGLIWFAAVSRDDRAREAALWLLDVTWKQKRNITKSMIALEVFGISREELLSRDLIKEVKSSGPSLRILERSLATVNYPMTSTHVVADPDGELIIVQGQLHFYRVFRSTGRIERASDNATLELDWASVPDNVRLYLHQESDSAAQLNLRATMLMYDSVFGSFFKVKQK